MLALTKNQYWGKRSGSITRLSNGVVLFEIWVRPGAKKHVEGPKRARHYTYVLSQNAIALGWHNGVRRTGSQK